MKKQDVIRKGIAVLCICTLTAGLWGCGTEEKSEEEKILRVVADGRLYKKAEAAAGFTEGTNSEIEVRIQRLPDEKETRENEIQKLRTEIMAGKGPDLFLLECIPENAEIEGGFLIDNPYKTMQSGALASLDTFMEKDSYWEDGNYNKTFLKAGQYDGRQYIIPMSVCYYVLPRSEDIEEMTGDTLEEWLEQIRASDDIRLKQALCTFGSTHSARWMQPAADYERKEVLLDKDKWVEFSEKYFQFRKEAYEEISGKENELYFRPLNKTLLTLYESQIDLQVVPDIEGRKMASIMSYGAVSMSSDRKKEAYDFLMLFLNDRTEQYRKKHADDSSMGLPSLYGYLDGNYMPVQKTAFEQWGEFPSEEMIQEMQESFREIDGAYFLTEGERALNFDVMSGNSRVTNLNCDIETEFSKIADTAIDIYKMLVEE
ncbi:hypothetical protein B5G11_12155 [Drancourtella sp. An57]|uniref:extracellular solute-binding protein n=1 Tax=Drancourtella sp. An57 TaxID=1965647 RepID=UPI000B3A333C|nr:extracellular solute-binding protein [Drancourtella sp. An57]OUN68704.1 hypothetical protein B5G11_12155 [Drancourtella sp. An57]